jgi:hypothetical protein
VLAMRVVVLFGDVDTDEHVDAVIIVACHAFSFESNPVAMLERHGRHQPPYESARSACPFGGQPHPDSTGGKTGVHQVVMLP